MRVGFRPPLLVLAVALLALILLLATLQYVWLGRISEAQRERLSGTLNQQTTEFAQDFDRELTRAYLLFQADVPSPDQGASARLSDRYDRWHATSASPRLIKDFYVATRGKSDVFTLQQFDTSSRTLIAAEWPASMADWQSRLAIQTEHADGSTLVIRRLAAPIWETVPALVVPAPMFFVGEHARPPSPSAQDFSYTLLTIDLDYVKTELLPSLAERHFRRAGDESEYQVAVIDRVSSGEPIYQSTAAFTPRGGENGDASAPLFQVRTQDFSALAAEVRRFATFSLKTTNTEQLIERRQGGRSSARPPNQFSIVVQQGGAERRIGARSGGSHPFLAAGATLAGRCEAPGRIARGLRGQHTTPQSDREYEHSRRARREYGAAHRLDETVAGACTTAARVRRGGIA